MTTKTVSIMFYDQESRSFVVDTMEVDDNEEKEGGDDLQESQNKVHALSFSTLL